jgi:hypothetical protein
MELLIGAVIGVLGSLVASALFIFLWPKKLNKTYWEIRAERKEQKNAKYAAKIQNLAFDDHAFTSEVITRLSSAFAFGFFGTAMMAGSLFVSIAYWSSDRSPFAAFIFSSATLLVAMTSLAYAAMSILTVGILVLSVRQHQQRGAADLREEDEPSNHIPT